MTVETRQRWHQNADGLLIQDDLPEGWYLPDRYPGERPDDGSDEIDAVLGYDDQYQSSQPDESEDNEVADGRWRYIEHTATGTRVMIRLQRLVLVSPEEIRITGVIYLPKVPGMPITSQMLRELPTAKIEALVNQRHFAMKRVTALTGNKIVLPSGQKLSEREVLKPLGNPKQISDFYERVALQHGKLTREGDKNPSATMATINGVALSTAQGWVAKARGRGLLPPGRRGRAG